MAEIPLPGAGRRDVTLSMGRVNLIALPLAIAPIIILPGAFLLLWGWPRLAATAPVLFRWEVLLPALLVGIVAHELLHAATWMIAGKIPPRAIRFGIQWKTVTPYAHCSVPMPAAAYRLGAAMPGLLLGALPACAGLAAGNGAWTLFGAFFTIAAAGDAIILWLLRGIPATVPVEDHPERAGCYVYDAPPPPAAGPGVGF